MSTITKDQVKHIASLAKLDLTEEELRKFTQEFSSILQYISQIDTCDVSTIQSEHNLKDFRGKNLYEDTVQSSKITREQMLQNASQGRNKNGYIRVSKIVDKG